MSSIWNAIDVQAKIISKSKPKTSVKQFQQRSIPKQPAKSTPIRNVILQTKLPCFLTSIPAELIAGIGQYLEFQWCTNLWRTGDKKLQQLIKQSMPYGNYQFVLTTDYFYQMVKNIPRKRYGKNFMMTREIQYGFADCDHCEQIVLFTRGCNKILRKIPRWWKFTLISTTIFAELSYDGDLCITGGRGCTIKEWRNYFLSLMMIRNKDTIRHIDLKHHENALIPALDYPNLTSIEIYSTYGHVRKFYCPTIKMMYLCINDNFPEHIYDFPNLEYLYIQTLETKYFSKKYHLFKNLKCITLERGAGCIRSIGYGSFAINNIMFDFFDILINSTINITIKFDLPLTTKLINMIKYTFADKIEKDLHKKRRLQFLFVGGQPDHWFNIRDTRHRDMLVGFIKKMSDREEFGIEFKFR
jgi:hypothetical protein